MTGLSKSVWTACLEKCPKKNRMNRSRKKTGKNGSEGNGAKAENFKLHAPVGLRLSGEEEQRPRRGAG